MQWGLGGFGLLVLTVLNEVNDLKVEHRIECSAARGNTQGDARSSIAEYDTTWLSACQMTGAG